MKLIRITSPHFCAGFVADLVVTKQCAPILAYMRGWTGRQVADYCKRKGWTWEALPC